MNAPDEAGRPIRVAIVDDHPIVRDGLKHLLQTSSRMQVVGEGMDGTDVPRLVRDARPDVLLLDFAMPNVNGLDALADLPQNATRVILLTVAMNPEDVLRAVQLGARGLVLKGSATRLLLDAIKRVMEGKYVIGADVSNDHAHVVATLARAAARPFGLTRRELEIVVAIADGGTNVAISERLSISLQTVKHHVTSIFLKTGVSTRLELALFAIDHGIVNRRPALRRRTDGTTG